MSPHQFPSSSLFPWPILFALAYAATFDVVKCTYPIWAAASPGGGRHGTLMSHLAPPWLAFGAELIVTLMLMARANVRLVNGDCNRVLKCQGYGSPPNT